MTDKNMDYCAIIHEIIWIKRYICTIKRNVKGLRCNNRQNVNI